MKGEEMVSRSMSPFHNGSSKEIETALPPLPPDENEKHAQNVLRRRPLSLNWKGFKSFSFGQAVSQMARVICVYTCVGVHVSIFISMWYICIIRLSLAGALTDCAVNDVCKYRIESPQSLLPKVLLLYIMMWSRHHGIVRSKSQPKIVVSPSMPQVKHQVIKIFHQGPQDCGPSPPDPHFPDIFQRGDLEGFSVQDLNM